MAPLRSLPSSSLPGANEEGAWSALELGLGLNLRAGLGAAWLGRRPGSTDIHGKAPSSAARPGFHPRRPKTNTGWTSWVAALEFGKARHQKQSRKQPSPGFRLFWVNDFRLKKLEWSILIAIKSASSNLHFNNWFYCNFFWCVCARTQVCVCECAWVDG